MKRIFAGASMLMLGAAPRGWVWWPRGLAGGDTDFCPHADLGSRESNHHFGGALALDGRLLSASSLELTSEPWLGGGVVGHVGREGLPKPYRSLPDWSSAIQVARGGS